MSSLDLELRPSIRPTIERALVFVGPTPITTNLVYVSGASLEREFSDVGQSMNDYEPAASAPGELGLWLWEGTVTWIGGRSYMLYDADDPEPCYEGEYRRLTVEEATRVAVGDFSLLEKGTDREWSEKEP